MIGQIPIPKFLEKEHQGILSKRLFHICMNICTKSLKLRSHNPGPLCDPFGFLRHVRPCLTAYLGDLPEKLMASGCSQNQSPISCATSDIFGSPTPSPLRQGAETLRKLRELLSRVDPLDLKKFSKEAKLVGLNGTNELFWSDWQFADPGEFLVPDALHDWHKFLMDHPVQWIRTLVGDKDLDRRFAAAQRRVGVRHFRTGFTRFRQHTGREQREISRQLLVNCEGHEEFTGPIMRAFRGLLNFVYYAQLESQSTETIGYLTSALAQFHDNKAAISATGVRDGPRMKGEFNIPKLELMGNAPRMIVLHGSLPQFSSEQTEHLHIGNAKVPYRHTNKKNFASQMVRFLDRQEKISLFTVFLEYMHGLQGHGDPLPVDFEAPEVDSLDPFEASLRHDRFGHLSRFFLTPGIRDAFKDNTIPQNESSAFIVKSQPDRKTYRLDAAADLYNLPNLRHALTQYFIGVSRSRDHALRALPFVALDMWSYVRIQLRTIQDMDLVLPPQTVTASPPSTKEPFGLCNFVLVKDSADLQVRGVIGIRGEQVNVLFRSSVANTSYYRNVRNGTLCCPNTYDLQAYLHRHSETSGMLCVCRTIQACAENRCRRPTGPKRTRTGR